MYTLLSTLKFQPISRRYLLTLALAVVSFSSCSKNNEVPEGRCAETPPTDELCQAFFTRWFYDAELGKCVQLSYSGCSAKGFETKMECQQSCE